MVVSQARLGVHCCTGYANHITLLTSEIFLILKHIWLQGFWRIQVINLYYCLGVMPEIQRSFFYSFFSFLACTTIRSLNLLNIFHLMPCPPNSSPISTALVQSLINSWLGTKTTCYLISQQMLRSILSRTPKMMISLKMETWTSLSSAQNPLKTFCRFQDRTHSP